MSPPQSKLFAKTRLLTNQFKTSAFGDLSVGDQCVGRRRDGRSYALIFHAVLAGDALEARARYVTIEAR
jgi:hypothetical protein